MKLETGGRLISLDILRTLALALVIFHHAAPPRPDEWGYALGRIWLRAGWIGVDLFFVLSGFLVSGLLFREYQKRGRMDVRRFYVRRGLKIYPAFYAMAAICLASLVHEHTPIQTQRVLAELLFVQNYFDHYWNHTWSLAVEEHFYVLIPLIVWMLTRRRAANAVDPFRPIPLIFAIVAVIELILRMVDRGDVFRDLHVSHLRSDSLLFGVMLAYLFHFHGELLVPICQKWWPAMLATAALLAWPAFVFDLDRFLSTVGLTMLYIASGLLLLTAVCNGWTFGKIGAAVAWVGAHSYSIYIWHMFVLEHGVNRIRLNYETHFGRPTPWLLYILLTGILCTTFGIVMAKAVEYPVLYFRDRWFPSRSVSPVELVETPKNRLR